MKYLVTGGAGFIGSTLVDELLFSNAEVICIDNFDDFYAEEIKYKNLQIASDYTNFRCLKMNLCDLESLDNLFRSQRFDAVFHLAARAGVRPSITYPRLYYENNVLGTLNLLEMMIKYSVKKMIFSSSSSVYGNNKKIPFEETDNVDNPISPYAATKKSCELLCYHYHYLYNLDIICARLFTVYGPRQRPDLAINKFTEFLLNDEEIQVFGDGSMKRDYTYINDIVNGLLKANSTLSGFEIINLGNSEPISILELIKMLEEITGKNAKLKFLPKPPGDVDITYADITKARKILGYNPVKKIEEGLSEFVKWKIG